MALMACLPVCLAQSRLAASSLQLSGSIAGYVRDVAGVPQMGATVALFNRQERQIFQAITNERGVFGFDGLAPETYSIRVSLSSFVPALKQRIIVQPGMQSLLYINMASLLSSVELVYAAPGQGALMSDDWKGTLKVSSSTRPVLRALPDWFPNSPGETPAEKPVGGTSKFADTRGVVQLSAGDPGSLGGAADSDYGTAFAVATSFLGRNQLELSGDVGYGMRTGMPAAAFRTTWSRDGFGPEVTLNMRQLSVPISFAQTSGLPALRTMSLTTRDHLELGDAVRLEYGASIDSVSFLDHFNYISPFARVTYDAGKWGTVRVAYSSGSQPIELERGNGAMTPAGAQADAVQNYDPELSHDLAALSYLPRVSLRDGRAQIQRTQNVELGYEKKLGVTKVQLSAFHENVSNGALSAASGDGVFGAGEVLPDLSDRTSILNVGSYQRYGYAASVERRICDRLEAGVAAGRAGALTTTGAQFDSNSADELRGMLHTSERFWASARAAATLPGAGTRIQASYQWNESGSLLPAHANLTGSTYTDAGLNIHVSQPLPGFPGMPGRLEATADMQNLTAQGYLPINASDNRRILLMQAPRAVRGGLSFIF